MTRTYCDRCGEEAGKPIYTVSIDGGAVDQPRRELCPGCLAALMKWFGKGGGA